MMEVLRILKATGLAPRRTIRIGLWGGEEEGLLGSREYVREHLGTRAGAAARVGEDVGLLQPRQRHRQDSRHLDAEQRRRRADLRAWIAPLKDLGVEILGPRSVTQTDHASFDTVGVPAFQFVQERYEYNSRTHHSNMDFLDRVQPNDMKQIATVAAMFVWQAANRDAAVAAQGNDRA